MGGGSSPQARGTRGIGGSDIGAIRFIPAGAGNTYISCYVWALDTVHPRRRGEHMIADDVQDGLRGSSPQARGTPIFRKLNLISSRFIPAGAGNTPRRDIEPPIKPVHPRRRGEHLLRRTDISESPRFIPAGAGNTDLVAPQIVEGSVHPRRRGEHVGGQGIDSVVVGSSPQARGTLLMPFLLPQRLRFIPAGAGNTLTDGDISKVRTVHPRRRGEHATEECADWLRVGSSPQARGTLNGLMMIPMICPVHPRRRGEHLVPVR